MTLATRLPWTHPFSGGYPRLGGQPLPTDPDAIDYLQRQAAVDGPVEVGVAMAVDAFVKGCKSDSAGYAGDPTRTVWDAMQACCIMAGARTISGALVPLRTPYGSELADIANLPTPVMQQSTGGTPYWNAQTRTASCDVGANNSFPRFFWNFGMVTGKRYRVTGRLSGDFTKLYGGGVRLGGGYISINADGTFDGVRSSSTFDGQTGSISLLFDSTSTPKSVTIESLSIREDSFTPAPYNLTNFDYDRTIGIQGDGSTTYLDSGRANNADGQDDVHQACFVSIKTSDSLKAIMGAGVYGQSGSTYLETSSNERLYVFSRNNFYDTRNVSYQLTGFLGASRQSSASHNIRQAGATSSFNRTSQSTYAGNAFVFATQVNGSPGRLFNGALSFYSIGSAISDLSLLDNRVSTLISSISTALS